LATTLDEPESSALIRLALRHNNLETALSAHNEKLVSRLMTDEATHFDKFSESGLTERQREAIVTNAPVTLVVAGAGTGKTTTIVAKIDYLVRRGLARPNEILVLAYNKQAQLELKARIENLAHGHQVRAMTFHAFGYGVVRHKSDVPPEPVTDSAPRSFVHREIDQIRRQEPLSSPLRKALDSFRADLATPEKTTTFVSNILSFLNRFKTRRTTIANLRKSVRTQRQLDFIVLFEHLVTRYNADLEQTNRVDFSDMIVRATDLISSGAHVPRYRYILIDEFQDITQARWRLIQSIRAHNRETRLFLVGDDWQSIYAFDDADVSIMTDLQKRESGVARIDLDTTFRFPQPLADVTSQFIMRNPKQLKKSIVSANLTDAGSPVNIHRFKESDPDRSRRAILIRILTSIAEKRPASNVLMLGRYNKTVPDNWSELVSMAQSLGLQLKYQTCHSAKGLEADEVIVLDVNGGAMGFPCHLADDEFLQLLPSPSEAFLDAEERRLFYVALTRSKSVVHLLVDDGKPSVFLEDFEPRTEAKPKS
jgi:DNA helicase-4